MYPPNYVHVKSYFTSHEMIFVSDNFLPVINLKKKINGQNMSFLVASRLNKYPNNIKYSVEIVHHTVKKLLSEVTK